MNRSSAALILCFLALGCAQSPVAQSPESLLSDELFAAPSEPVSVAEVFALSASMREFLESELAPHYKGKRQALIEAVSQGQLKLEYDSVRTRNAAEAFQAKSGNCLSLVIMTAAFAKAMGLDVQYNSAAFGDLWSRSGNIYFLNGHVNVTLGKRYSDPRTLYDAAELMTIDFLPGHELRGLRTTPIDEPTILAMYLNNRAAEALLRGRLDDAYWFAREAMGQSPQFMGAYNTLGVVYLRRGEPARGERVFRRVLEREPENTRAWANLALTLEKLGRRAEAAVADRELARIERHAPFHFFHLGIAAMEAGDFKAARAAFAKEVRRAPEYHEFHFWLGLAELRLGNVDAARSELALALEYSTTRRDHDLYAAKLDRLSTRRQ
ncbi:MAG TPA: tetratricopeptide repeat protein [Burkholderiales bacterium]|nr:tetratricopeptide repeat protein [Burkholderiales bacterium]